MKCKDCKYGEKGEKIKYYMSGGLFNSKIKEIKYEIINCHKNPETIKKDLDDYCWEFKKRGSK